MPPKLFDYVLATKSAVQIPDSPVDDMAAPSHNKYFTEARID